MESVHVVKRPLLTEKGTHQNELGQYLFEVAVTARKPEIKKAIEDLYKVRVVSVNTMTRRARTRMTKFGAIDGKITKKAVVTLREGDAIELF